MVKEHVMITITPGQEESFEQKMEKGKALLLTAEGATEVTLLRGIEHTSTFVLMIDWDSVDYHTAFTTTPEFKEFGALVGPLFASKPEMQHFYLT
jgi:heme-degrading monooxygenase HmoA